ncbi:sigma-54-dependent transcriptional regulator [Halodesulfovibrio marinisediminis]|uniref:DNA-binding transcriptional response regulator, NtrC family, contains REC, AAA-type ATPase, and a Fis-type DNA-binding domains n=1 Tax=Halodesulfovibrio marinisediminis DSM 17456 TaxID=1121457 RepID=A0A1N6H2D5_9BACT|nr:sigma-54 dependent transcriptional regulator [Halodesulfovibrio marinisediminis]SIO13926.1 DNA-binding transcriptional response regulator, NtrC family, contains REC, AAA-type ATPase, and a Fis-type DNA-binding domains [Halodesulfovibrio marinisediminis DSM 17456]
MARVLIVDNDPVFSETLSSIVTGLGHRSKQVKSLNEAFASGRKHDTDIVYLNTQLPDGNGLLAIAQFNAMRGHPEIIVMTGTPTPDGAEKAIRNGAWDYVEKQSTVDRMVLPLIRAIDYRGKRPTKNGAVKLKRGGIIGNSAGIKKCLSLVAEAASSDASALLLGETGVGKEVFARAIHENSLRATGPFVAVDCASMSRTLASSILFGHRKGAFTGADKDREGLVAQANNGTLFLDEVGELPLAMQKIFLRVLQEHRFRPVGARTEKTSDFRLICATNRDLDEMVARGTFRSDLLFRIRTVVMALPPLRDRADDLPKLIEHYVKQLCGKYGMPAKGISPDLLDIAKKYPWPGNVRELIHTLERAVLASKDTPKIFSRHLPDHIRINIARAAADRTQREEPPIPLHKGASCAISDAEQGLDNYTVRLASSPKEQTRPRLVHPQSPPSLRPNAEPNSVGISNNKVHSSELPRQGEHSLAAPISSQSGTEHYRQDSAYPDKKIGNSAIADTLSSPDSIKPFFEFRDEIFTQYLQNLMTLADGKVATACKLSGLSRSYLYDLLKKYTVKK